MSTPSVPAELPTGALAPRPVRVLAWRRENRDTATLSLEADGRPWLPGQFEMLYAYGVGEIPASISGDPGQAARVVHTVHAAGPVGGALCRLRPGQWVGLRGPFGSAWPLAEARGRDVVVVAWGQGLTGLRPAMYALLRSRRDYRRVTLVCGARTPADLLFPAEVERWRRLGAIDVRLTVAAAGDGWTGEVGPVSAPLRAAAVDLVGAEAVAMVCAPEAMTRLAVAELRRLGLPDSATWISMERTMLCSVGLCGRCVLGTASICRQGPVFRLDAVAGTLARNVR
jgi:NAD(P)H-flavin reductase